MGDDFRRVFARYAGPRERGPFANLPPGATYRTPFGVEPHGYGYGMPLNRPLLHATTVAEVQHGHAWPDPEWMDVSHVREEALAHGGRYAILGGGYVASPSHDCLLPETPVENVLAAYEAIREHGGC